MIKFAATHAIYETCSIASCTQFYCRHPCCAVINLVARSSHGEVKAVSTAHQELDLERHSANFLLVKQTTPRMGEENKLIDPRGLTGSFLGEFLRN